MMILIKKEKRKEKIISYEKWIKDGKKFNPSNDFKKLPADCMINILEWGDFSTMYNTLYWVPHGKEMFKQEKYKKRIEDTIYNSKYGLSSTYRTRLLKDYNFELDRENLSKNAINNFGDKKYYKNGYSELSKILDENIDHFDWSLIQDRIDLHIDFLEKHGRCFEFPKFCKKFFGLFDQPLEHNILALFNWIIICKPEHKIFTYNELENMMKLMAGFISHLSLGRNTHPQLSLEKRGVHVYCHFEGKRIRKLTKKMIMDFFDEQKTKKNADKINDDGESTKN